MGDQQTGEPPESNDAIKSTRGVRGARQRLSACLIVQNEQAHLPAALDSVGFCDEIVVVDGGSTDRTVEIAREHGATIVESPWPGFAAQRNVALDAATSEWVFELDADERVSPRLRASILALLANPPPGVSIAVCPLRNRFLGGMLGPSAKYPAYRSRLFRHDAYRHDESREVHEGIEPRERPAVLDGDLEHELAATLGEALRDARHYAQLESAHIGRARSPIAFLNGVVLRPAAKLAYRTIVDGGLRDGWRGALKIGLDAVSDALVWIFALRRASPRSSQSGEAKGADNERRHFGRRPAGPPKVIALAGQGAPALRARKWLAGLRSQGIDVALLSNEDEPSGTVPQRRVGHLRPLATMRALDVEMQLRTAHAVVPVGRRARLVSHLLPSTLRPKIRGLDVQVDPTRAARLARAALASRPDP
jgi:hypothetical protein